MSDAFYADIVDAATGTFKFFSAGEWKTSTSGKAVSIGNPTTGETAFKVQGACVKVLSGGGKGREAWEGAVHPPHRALVSPPAACGPRVLLQRSPASVRAVAPRPGPGCAAHLERPY